MSIKWPGHVLDTTTEFRQQFSSNVQGMYLTLLLYLCNNEHQMSMARTWYYHNILGVMFVKCPEPVPGITSICRQ